MNPMQYALSSPECHGIVTRDGEQEPCEKPTTCIIDDLLEAREPERTPDPCPGCSHGFHGLRCVRIVYSGLWPVKCGCVGAWTEEGS
jgi:hypothetical protein